MFAVCKAGTSSKPGATTCTSALPSRKCLCFVLNSLYFSIDAYIGRQVDCRFDPVCILWNKMASVRKTFRMDTACSWQDLNPDVFVHVVVLHIPRIELSLMHSGDL